MIGALEWWQRISAPIWPQALADGVATMPLDAATDVLVGRLVGGLAARSDTVSAPLITPFLPRDRIGPFSSGKNGELQVLSRFDPGTFRVLDDGQVSELDRWSERLLLWLLALQEIFDRFLFKLWREILDRDPEKAEEAVRESAGGQGASAGETMAEQAWGGAYGSAQREIQESPESVPVWPYMVYLTRRDDRVRPNHRTLEGFVAASDWSNWGFVEPPNGYRCRCRLVPVDYATAERRGWTGRFPVGTAHLEAFIAAGGPDEGFPKTNYQLS